VTRKDERAGAVFAALSDPTRREVVRYLTAHGPSTPTELAAHIPVTRQAISKHLVALGDAGLVSMERAGREAVYRLTPAPLAHAMSWMADAGAAWDERIDALRDYLRR
jgi:DNA-binding transcriptional ArsR family regulator